jgi:hypothetical protein
VLIDHLLYYPKMKMSWYGKIHTYIQEAEEPWVSDPVTGHYRAAPVDPADLRAAHLARTYARV